MDLPGRMNYPDYPQVVWEGALEELYWTGLQKLKRDLIYIHLIIKFLILLVYSTLHTQMHYSILSTSGNDFRVIKALIYSHGAD